MTKMLKSKFFRLIVPGLIVAVGIWQTNILPNILSRQSTVGAAGDLTIDWGVPTGQAIFVVENMLPGDEETKDVKVTNDAMNIRPVGVRGVKTEETGNLASVLQMIISVDGTEIYGSSETKTVQQFFDESAGPDALFLTNVNPGVTKTISFKVVFPTSAGDEYQAKKVVFDLLIGISMPIPDECKDIPFSGNPIFGTQGNDILQGTNGNDLIFGLEGNDRIDASNGHDCIVGGEGNDSLDASNGNDFVFGDSGNDRINGSNGNDFISGGPGNDIIDGSNNNDKIYGDEGNDRLFGRNNNDLLVGGEGNDRADGGLNTDQCEAETEANCEL